MDLHACSNILVGSPDIIFNYSVDSQVRIYNEGLDRSDETVVSIFKKNNLIKSFTLKEVCGHDLYKADVHLTRIMVGCGPNFTWNPHSILKTNDNLLNLSAECGNIKIDLKNAKLIQRADFSLNPFHKIWGFFANLYVQNYDNLITIIYLLKVFFLIGLVIFIGRKIYVRLRRKS